ncbi:MAG: hypothetical protein GSR80_000917 [Desulfurococcales archaeon]|nr:hypothetical protein [Desulfurococcales archaeon]
MGSAELRALRKPLAVMVVLLVVSLGLTLYSHQLLRGHGGAVKGRVIVEDYKASQ